MVSKKFILLLVMGFFMPGLLWAQSEPWEEVDSPEEVTEVQTNTESFMPSEATINEDIGSEEYEDYEYKEDDILWDEEGDVSGVEDVDDFDETFLDEEADDEAIEITEEADNNVEEIKNEEEAPEDRLSAEEGNQGYIYGSAVVSEETQKPPKKPMSLWQRIIKIDEWFQEKFW